MNHTPLQQRASSTNKEEKITDNGNITIGKSPIVSPWVLISTNRNYILVHSEGISCAGPGADTLKDMAACLLISPLLKSLTKQ